MAIETLFGPSLADVQELRRRQAEQEIQGAGQQFGVFAPLYQAGLRFGNQAVQGVNTLLGAQDPMLKQATAVQEVLSKYQDQDPSNPITLEQISRDLFPVAPDAALRALTLSRQLAKQSPETFRVATAAEKQAAGLPIEGVYQVSNITGKLSKVATPAEDSVFGKIDPTKFKPASLRKYQETRDIGVLESIEKDTALKPSTDFLQIGQGIGIPAKGSLSDYTVEETKQINDEIQRRKESTQRAGVPQTPTEKTMLPGSVKARDEVLNAALQGTKTLRTADAIDRTLNSAFVGLGADAKLKAAQLANAFGVEITGTSESEQLRSLLAQLAQGQAKTLPGSLSEKELAFLREAIGTPGFTVNTLRNVVKRLRADAMSSEIEYQEIQNFTNQGGDLNKFDFVGNRKKAQTAADARIAEQEQKMKRLQELERKARGR